MGGVGVMAVGAHTAWAQSGSNAEQQQVSAEAKDSELSSAGQADSWFLIQPVDGVPFPPMRPSTADGTCVCACVCLPTSTRACPPVCVCVRVWLWLLQVAYGGRRRRCSARSRMAGGRLRSSRSVGSQTSKWVARWRGCLSPAWMSFLLRRRCRSPARRVMKASSLTRHAPSCRPCCGGNQRCPHPHTHTHAPIPHPHSLPM